MTSSSASPLGRYAEAVAAIITVAAVLAAIGIHIAEAWATLGGAVVPNLNLTWIDGLALTVVGYVFGSRAAMNGASRQALAAHARLDALNAPSAASVVETAPPRDAAHG